MSKKGSGVVDIINPGIEKFMKTKEYYDLCKKYDIVSDCFENEHFEKSDKAPPAYSVETKSLKTKCSDGYCPCP